MNKLRRFLVLVTAFTLIVALAGVGFAATRLGKPSSRRTAGKYGYISGSLSINIHDSKLGEVIAKAEIDHPNNDAFLRISTEAHYGNKPVAKYHEQSPYGAGQKTLYFAPMYHPDAKPNVVYGAHEVVGRQSAYVTYTSLEHTFP